MPELIELLEISPEKVAYVILRAREVDLEPVARDEDSEPELGVPDAEASQEDLPGGADAGAIQPAAGDFQEGLPADAARKELEELLDKLNGNEQASLIALAWIGQGTYAPGELDEAMAAAKAIHWSHASTYLLSLPLLLDHLEDALDQLGLSAGGADTDIMRRANA